ncbi:hypothetical protein PGB90_008370 [Kerria lacca]
MRKKNCNEKTDCLRCRNNDAPGRSDSSETEIIEEYSNVVVTFCKTDIIDLSDDMTELLAAIHEPLPNDYNIPSPPPWLDIEKLKKGQAFGLKYLFGLNYSQMMSLLLLFSSHDGLKPLIYTGKSHTPLLAFKRYLSTTLRVKSWYETEIWRTSSVGYKNLKYVRCMHLNVSKKMNNMSVNEIHCNSNLEEKLKDTEIGMLCPLSSTLKKDFSQNGQTCPIVVKKEERVYLNQMEMCFTQFGFFGLMLLYPDKFTAKNATEEELANFVHLWRYIGYMLGIKEEYNLCKGDVNEVVQRSRHLVEYFIRPMVLHVNKEWEHMSRCALQGIEKFTKLRINFESTILYFFWVLNIKTPNLIQYVSWKELTLFNITKFLMTESHKVPAFLRFLNYCVKKNLENEAKEKNKKK